MDVRTKTPRLEETMLDAAAKLFGQQRFHEVRMEDVAARAGVAKGTLYRYFQDKEEMYDALLRRASADFVAELAARVAQETRPQAKLVAVVQAILDYFDRQPHIFDLIQRAEVRYEQALGFPWLEARTETLRLVADIFRQAKAQGAFAIARPKAAALMFLGGLRAIYRFGSAPRPRRLAQQIVSDFLRGAAK